MDFNLKYRGEDLQLFFVLKGLVNGEEGVTAQKSGSSHGTKLADGWYFLIGDDVDGQGPWEFREEAQQYGEMAIAADLDERLSEDIQNQIGELRAQGYSLDSIREAFENGLSYVGELEELHKR